LDPKHNFLGHFEPFRYSTKVDAKQAEQAPLMHKFAKQSDFGVKTHVLGRFKPFYYSTKVDAKLVDLVLLMHKFAKQSDIGKFHNERT
jgi:hypothetical protein